MNKPIAGFLFAYIFVSATHSAAPAVPDTGKTAAAASTNAPAAPVAGSTPLSNPPSQPADKDKPSATAASQQTKPPELEITGLLKAPRFNDKYPVSVLEKDGGSVGLSHELWVQVAPKPPKTSAATASATSANESETQPLPLDAGKYVLFLNGDEVRGLDPAILKTYTSKADGQQRALAFKLKRTPANKALWDMLLGTPTARIVQVSVSLAERYANGKTAAPSIFGDTPHSTFNLEIFAWWRLAVAALLVGGVIWLVFARAGKSTTLRDGLLPQIEPKLQTYSLGRSQMAFWFVLIFCSFVFLFFLTWDYNTISSQALVLMGISGGTALAAIAIDVAKDSPADHANRGLRALGLNSFDDVLRLEQAIYVLKDTLAKSEKQLEVLLKVPQPSAEQQQQIAQLKQDIPKLNTDLLGRRSILRTYYDKTRPFLTQGFFKDLTSDLNGPAVHRLQVFCWTIILGAIFLIGVYRDLAMPDFNGTLLALMGISSAGYVGFKYPEKNN